MDTLKDNLTISWNEAEEALTSLNQLSDKEIIECLPAIKNRIKTIKDLLSKYVDENDLDL